MMRILDSKKIIVIYLLAFISPLLWKTWYVDNLLFSDTLTRMYGGLQVIAHDSIIYFSMLLLLYLSFIKGVKRAVSLILRLCAIIMFSIYVADILVLKTFATHLTISDILKYGGYAPQFIQQLYGGKKLLLGFMAIVFAGIFFSIIFDKHTLNKKVHGIFVVTLTFLLLCFCFRENDRYVHSWMYKNVAEYNYTALSQAAPYSEEFVKKNIAETAYKDTKFCRKHKSQRKNIIILMVESLSSYQSKFFSGINNWTPHIDSIAANNLSFTNFYANGFTTEDALIAVLTGVLPFYAPAIYSNGGGTCFKGFYEVPNPLPMIAKKNGYTTEFITSVDLRFGKIGTWAKSIGFDYIEGHDYPYYDNWKRYRFNAAPDEALYNRVFDRILHNQSNKQYLLFVVTGSSHTPFINPENDHHAESDTFGYVDKQIGSFYQRLLQSGFFKNGLLIIVGDHHAMIPLKRDEIKKFGAAHASARIPLVVSFGDRGGVVEKRPFQQVDIFNSLRNLISDEQCTSAWLGDLLSSDRLPAQYIAHKRGDHRDIISIFYGGRELRVKLDGDDTRIVNPENLDDAILKVIVNKINNERISRQRES